MKWDHGLVKKFGTTNQNRLLNQLRNEIKAYPLKRSNNNVNSNDKDYKNSLQSNKDNQYRVANSSLPKSNIVKEEQKKYEQNNFTHINKEHTYNNNNNVSINSYNLNHSINYRQNESTKLFNNSNNKNIYKSNHSNLSDKVILTNNQENELNISRHLNEIKDSSVINKLENNIEKNNISFLDRLSQIDMR